MQNGELTISHDKLAVNSARYFIRPGDAQHFEILIKDSTSEADFSALRTNDGFCVNMRWLQVNARRTWVRSAIAECFVRAG